MFIIVISGNVGAECVCGRAELAAVRAVMAAGLRVLRLNMHGEPEGRWEDGTSCSFNTVLRRSKILKKLPEVWQIYVNITEDQRSPKSSQSVKNKHLFR